VLEGRAHRGLCSYSVYCGCLGSGSEIVAIGEQFPGYRVLAFGRKAYEVSVVRRDAGEGAGWSAGREA